MTEFILNKSNAREKTREILYKYCEEFEGWNPELIEFVKDEDVLNEIMGAIQEGLDDLDTKVAFNCSSFDFDVDIDVTVYKVQGDLHEEHSTNQGDSRLVKFYVYAQNFGTDDGFIICDNVIYRIEMLREE